MNIDADFLKNYSFAITIDDDRFDRMRRLFSHYGLDIPKKFRGFTSKKLDAVSNCSLSHSTMVKFAKSMDWPYVCIFEDDAYPARTANQVLCDVPSIELPDDIDILLLGWFETFNTRDVSLNNEHVLKKIDGKYLDDVYFAKFHGTHSFIVFKNAYDKIIDYYNVIEGYPADVIFSTACQNIYSLNECVFIQYNQDASHVGNLINYQYDGRRNQSEIPANYDKIENIFKPAAQQ